MNVFFEFHKVVKALQDRKVSYAVVGGVAMAFHSYARFTKDIDILTKESEFGIIEEILKKEGYHASGEPWTFKNLLTLHRFWKIEDNDEMVVDVLVSGCARHDQIIDEALEAFAKHTGRVFVAKKEDLIWMKEQRNSPQDQADSEVLKHETHE